MHAGEFIRDARVRVGALVCVCFLLGSTGWLSWLRNIMGLADPAQVDFYTMVMGYIAQAAGIGAFMALAGRVGAKAPGAAAVSAVAYVVLLEPASMGADLAVVLGFGWAMNVLCGIMQGHYLMCLAGLVEQRRRGTVFGCGYALTTGASWLLSTAGGGVLAAGVPCLAVCAVLACLSVALVAVCGKDFATLGAGSGADPDEGFDARSDAGAAKVLDAGPAEGHGEGMAQGPDPSRRALLALACVVVVLVSLVKNAGFSFPTEDLSGVVDLELSRLFYGVGLVAAGIVADRNRRHVLAACAISLAIPFLMLALSGAGASSVVLWAIGYLLFGFFAVFRVTLLADLAAQDGRSWIAGAGLMFGRMGDVLGTAVFLLLGAWPIALILVTGVLFVAAMWLLFALYRRLYDPVSDSADPDDGRDVFGEFCGEYGLSMREREVLPLLVQGKTYAAIAEDLFVTENTVKFHVRNIRQKTGCATRMEVTDLFTGYAGRR